MLPVFLYNCAGTVEKQQPIPAEWVAEEMSADAPSGICNLDLFVFRDDNLQKLDCYQRIEDIEDWDGTVTSGSGGRIITAVANSLMTREDWFMMNSRSYLKNVALNLEEERREFPFMSGEAPVPAGSGASFLKRLALRPYACEIVLRSISCDFSGRIYEGEKLKDVKVYLTNVNAETRVTEEEGSLPIRIINAGGPDEDDIEAFCEPDLIMQEIREEVGTGTLYPDIRLWCYQSSHPDETPGTPYTRLVIEGKLDGHTYYWPIEINRETEDDAGVRRNCRYTFDIKITRKGSLDPDTPVKAGEITINHEVAEWKEKDEYSVSF